MYLQEQITIKLSTQQNYELLESLTIQWYIKFKTNLLSLTYRPPSSTRYLIPIRMMMLSYWVTSTYPRIKKMTQTKKAFSQSWTCTT